MTVYEIKCTRLGCGALVAYTSHKPIHYKLFPAKGFVYCKKCYDKVVAKVEERRKREWQQAIGGLTQ